MPFSRLFVFQKKSVGIRVTEEFVEVAEVMNIRGEKKAVSVGRSDLGRETVVLGKIHNEQALTEALRNAIQHASPRPIHLQKAIFGLPDEQVYLYTFEMLTHPVSEQKQRIAEEVARRVPIEKDDLLFRYRVFQEDLSGASESDRNSTVIVAATSKQVVAEWKQFFQKLHIEVTIFDVCTVAMFRGLFPSPPIVPVCIIDIQETETNVSAFDHAGPRYFTSLSVTKESLILKETRVLEKSREENGKLEKARKTHPKNVFVSSFSPKNLEPLLNAVKETRARVKKITGKDIAEIIFIGEAKKLEELLDYFRACFGLWVRVGRPSLLIHREKQKERAFPREQESAPETGGNFGALIGAQYIEATGLALGGWEEKDFSFQLVDTTKHFLPAVAAEKKQTVKDRPSFKEWIEGKKKKQEADPAEPLHIKIKEPSRIHNSVWFGVAGVFLILIIGGGIWFFADISKEKAGSPEETGPVLNSQPSDNVEPLDTNLGTEDSETPDTVPEHQLQIQETETGWLNVRSGPGLNNAILKKVLPGETYPFIKKEGRWYNIMFPDNTDGWVLETYITEIE